jgi:AsmA protein
MGAGLCIALLAPPGLWLLLVAGAPTGWARDRLVAALRRETGHEVRLEAVRVGFLGELKLQGLELARPDRVDDPWLRAESILIDVNAAELLGGCLEPGWVEARGVFLRVHRDANGQFELGHLLRHHPRPSGDAAPGASASEEALPEVGFRLAEARVVIIDEPTGTRLELADLGGQGTWRPDRTTLRELRGRLNGGPFLLEGEFERGPGCPMFEGELHARKVAIGQGMGLLGYIAPVLAGTSTGLEGRLDLNLYLRGQGDTPGELERSVIGRGAVRIDPVTLDESPILAELGRVLALPRGVRVGSVGGDFEVARGRVATRDLTVEVGGLPIVLDGWTDYGGRVDYRIRSEGVAEAVARELRSLFEDLPVRVDDVLDLRLRGEPGRYELTLGGLPINRDWPSDEKARLREAARLLRDRLLR